MISHVGSLQARASNLFKSGFGKRLVYGTALNAGGQGVIILGQLSLPPLLIAIWGFKLYGVWLILITIPVWIAILDLGFGLAASNAVLDRLARGEPARAQAAFSVLLYFSLSMIGFLGLLSWLGLSSLIGAFAGIMDVERALIEPVVPPMLAVALLGIFASSLFNACRAVGAYLRGTAANVFFLALDPVIILAMALLGAGLQGAAVALALSAAARVAALLGLLWRMNPGLSFSPAYIQGSEFRSLLPLALSAFALPAATALSLQATVLIITQAFGLAAGASFALVRTLSRMIFQAVSVVVRSCLVDYTSAVASGDARVVRQIESVIRSAVAAIVLPGVLLFVLLGPSFVELWTHGEAEFPTMGYLLLGIGIAAHVIWNVDLMLLIAVNRHRTVAAPLISAQLVTVAVVWACSKVASFELVLATLAMTEIVVCVLLLWGKSLIKGRMTGAAY